MNDIEKNQLATLARVRDFGAQNPTIFPAGQLTGELMAAISAAVDELTTHTTNQETSTGQARQGSENKATARAALRDDLEAINRAAHAMAFDTPGLIDKFRIPHGSDHDLLTAARAFLAEATPMKSEFIRFGLPADFIDDLSADILAFEQATTARNQSLESRTASVTAIDETLAHGMKALKQLDLILSNVLRNDRAMLNAWLTASHVERIPHRRKNPPAPPVKPEPQPSQ
ncbi:MAG TPA: hypothetical protein VKA60_05130 [Blastocatellia bacterium]|nr:hypothetical protein [Blastocatellia bacterium]